MAASKNTALVWIEHYLFGLFAQTFNGTIATAVAILAEATAGKLPEGVTFANTWHTLAIAMLGYALMYFHAHPFPDDLTTINTTTCTTSSDVQPGPVATIAVPIAAPVPSETTTAASRMNAAAR